jgi:hypothetical protein
MQRGAPRSDTANSMRLLRGYSASRYRRRLLSPGDPLEPAHVALPLADISESPNL